MIRRNFFNLYVNSGLLEKKCVAIKMNLKERKKLEKKKLYFRDIFIYEVWNETICYETIRRKKEM